MNGAGQHVFRTLTETGAKIVRKGVLHKLGSAKLCRTKDYNIVTAVSIDATSLKNGTLSSLSPNWKITLSAMHTDFAFLKYI